jgi:hypothetical protein
VWAIDRKGRSQGKDTPVTRKALIALVLGIAAFTVAPAANAMFLSADGGGSSTPVKMTTQQAQLYTLHADVLSGSGIPLSVSMRPDVLGGNGTPSAVSIRTDVLGGTGSAASVALRSDVLGGNGGSAVRETPALTTNDRFAWGDATYGALVALAAMLLAATAVYTMRRRTHRLSF